MEGGNLRITDDIIDLLNLFGYNNVFSYKKKKLRKSGVVFYFFI